MGLYMPDGTAGLADVLGDLLVDLTIINQITSDLDNNEDQVKNSGFQRMRVSGAVFGASTIGGSLGHHHTMAHQTATDVLGAVLKDLQTFRDGLQTFTKAVDDADTTSAADNKARAQAVLALTKASGFDQTQTRNQHFHPGAPGGTHA
ncbi:MAG: hypothetical protein ACR2K3_07200 [Nocardioides sp.]